MLDQLAINLQESKIRDSISSRGKVSCSLDLTSIGDLVAGTPSFPDLPNGIRKIQAISKSLVLSVEVTFCCTLGRVVSLIYLNFSNSILRGKSRRRLRLYLKQIVFFKDTTVPSAFLVQSDTNFPRVLRRS